MKFARNGQNPHIALQQSKPMVYHKPCQNHHHYEKIFGNQAGLTSADIISFTNVLFDKSGKFHIVSVWYFITLIGGHWQDVRYTISHRLHR